ncbi:MAG: hypothetical protein ACYDEQ_07700 [Desulfocucumaceae bacterium]
MRKAIFVLTLAIVLISNTAYSPLFLNVLGPAAAFAKPADSGLSGGVVTGSGTAVEHQIWQGIVGNAPESSLNTDSKEDQDGTSVQEESDPNKGLIDSLQGFTTNIKKILQGDLMDIILEWIGKQFDKFFKNVNGVLGTAFIYTPPLHTLPWVHSCWSFFFWISMSILVFALVIAVGGIFNAKGEGDNFSHIILILKSFALAIASFYLIELAIYFANKLATGTIQNTIAQIGGLGANIKVGDPAAGDIIVKLMFTPDAAFGAKTGDSAQLYSYLIKEGGLVLLFIGYPILFLIALAALARYILMLGMSILSPIWHVGSGLSGKQEIMVGFWYQMGRLLSLEVIGAFVWIACARLQLAEIGKLKMGEATSAAVKSSDTLGIGISANFAVIIILLIYLVVSAILVWKSWMATLKDPVSLGGAGVMTGVSKAGGAAASASRWLSKKFDNPTWERRSMKLGEASKRAGETGKRWAERSSSPWKKKTTQALDGSIQGADKAASQVMMNQEPYQIETQPVSAPDSSGRDVLLTSIKVPAADRTSLLTGIIKSMSGKSGVSPHPNLSDSILVAPGQVDSVIEYLDSYYADKTRYWSDGSDYVTVENGLPVVRKSPPAGGIHMGSWKR